MKQGERRDASLRERAIRVVVRADSALELAGLEAIVRGGASLELVDSAASADVLLERIRNSSEPESAAGESGANEHDMAGEGSPEPTPSRYVPRVMLADEEQFGELAAVALSGESAIRGVLPAWASEEEIRAAIAGAAWGLLVIHPEASGYAFDSLEAPGRVSPAPQRTPSSEEVRGQMLSPRETEILNLLAAGLANKEIAFRLGISEHTVKFHVTSIFTKLDVTTRAAAVAIGIRTGLISL